MSMPFQNVAPTEQHSDGLYHAIQSSTPPSYEEEMHLPSYEEAIRDQVPEFPASSLRLERRIKFMCSYADAQVEQRLQSGQDVLDLDIGIEQRLIHACAIYPVTRQIFQRYIHKHRIYLMLAGFQWERVLRGSEQIEWGIERVEVTNDETDDETDDDEEPSQMMGSRIEG
ncbi:uncharacterized protein EAE98_003944 [Botrytis deweyae]|uniref:Uncharacterized protein n=2 Tax=Botrytis TaxID=33196 RepID=A0A4Z1K7S9_9HELO|nr:uncharacterized protein EAE98_003944 [Botrytis deweyae]KAF7932645.1 hypothetical protein EAE98_003944 [Botrytis deweyae]KAF7939776.1 hypothetical protein EAE99_001581 [Botrytis elliptica]TGO77437.1 hypothetical protein BELL_0108g00140 [Botrytis elliptica]